MFIENSGQFIVPFIAWMIHQKLFVQQNQIAGELAMSKPNLPTSLKPVVDLPSFKSEFPLTGKLASSVPKFAEEKFLSNFKLLRSADLTETQNEMDLWTTELTLSEM